MVSDWFFRPMDAVVLPCQRRQTTLEYFSSPSTSPIILREVECYIDTVCGYPLLYTMIALPTFALRLTVSKILNKLSTIFPAYSNNANRLSAIHPLCLRHTSLASGAWTICSGKTIPSVALIRSAPVTPDMSPDADNSAKS